MERPFRHIRQDFFLARSFRTIEDLNALFDTWRRTIANARVHATTNRVVEEAFAEEKPSLQPHPAFPYKAVLTVERRVSHDGMVAVDGNHYSVPDTTRRRTLDVQNHTNALRIFEDGVEIACHPVPEEEPSERHWSERHWRKPAPRGSRPPQGPTEGPGTETQPVWAAQAADLLWRRRRPPGSGRWLMSDILERVRGALVGLKMPRALETLDHTLQRMEKGEIAALEAIDSLLSEDILHP